VRQKPHSKGCPRWLLLAAAHVSTELIKREIGAKLARYRADPVAMVVEEFGAEPDAPQVDLLPAFADPEKRRIAMKAAKGPGKTTGLVWCALAFMLCAGRRGSHPKAAVTSNSAANLSDGFWSELAKWYSRSPLFMKVFELTKTRFFARDHSETWFLAGKNVASLG
jgi:hypothetical protein